MEQQAHTISIFKTANLSKEEYTSKWIELITTAERKKAIVEQHPISLSKTVKI